MGYAGSGGTHLRGVRALVEERDLRPAARFARLLVRFASIHPFNDGNGRMSRLIALLLTCCSGYDVGKYISIEVEIERTKGTYFEALAASSVEWADCRLT